MRALLTIETEEKASGSYHIAAENGDTSLCGAVNTESPFAAKTYRTLSEDRAEKLGLEVCGRCETIADSSRNRA